MRPYYRESGGFLDDCVGAAHKILKMEILKVLKEVVFGQQLVHDWDGLKIHRSSMYSRKCILRL